LARAEFLKVCTIDVVEAFRSNFFRRFGKLKLYGTFHVGKDKLSWQELECYLFAEMLICVREKRNALSPTLDGAESLQNPTKCSLKGSIMIKRHLSRLEESAGIASPSHSPPTDLIQLT